MIPRFSLTTGWLSEDRPFEPGCGDTAKDSAHNFPRLAGPAERYSKKNLSGEFFCNRGLEVLNNPSYLIMISSELWGDVLA